MSSAATGAVRRIDLGTLAVGEPILAGRGSAGIAVAHGLLWASNSRSATVTRGRPGDPRDRRDPIAVGDRPGGIDAGTEAVWVAI